MSYFKIMYRDDFGLHETLIGADNEFGAIKYLMEEKHVGRLDIRDIFELKGTGILTTKLLKPNPQQILYVQKTISEYQVHFYAGHTFKRWQLKACGVDVDKYLESGHLVPYEEDKDE